MIHFSATSSTPSVGRRPRQEAGGEKTCSPKAGHDSDQRNGDGERRHFDDVDGGGGGRGKGSALEAESLSLKSVGGTLDLDGRGLDRGSGDLLCGGSRFECGGGAFECCSGESE